MANKVLLSPSTLNEMTDQLQRAYDAILKTIPESAPHEHPANEAIRCVYGVMLDLLNILDLNEKHSDQYTFDWSFMSPVNAAKVTGMAESWWRNNCAANKIPGAFKIGKQWIVPVEAVIEEGKKRGREIKHADSTSFLVQTEQSSQMIDISNE